MSAHRSHRTSSAWKGALNEGVGRRIRQVREQHGLSRADFVKRLAAGISVPSLEGFELGSIAVPLAVVVAITEEFDDLTLDDLVPVVTT